MLKNVFKLASEAITASILTAMHKATFKCRGKNPHIYWIVSQLLVMILLNNFGRIICSNMRFHPHINVCVNISSKVCILCIYLAHLSLTGKIHLRS